MNVPKDYATTQNDPVVHIEVFDPDCYSPGGADKFDELRSPNPTNQYDAKHPSQHAKEQTTTVYELWKGDEKIAEHLYSDDPASNEMWVEPPGFALDTSVHGTGNFQIKVKAVDGSSENGFLLRAGPTKGLGLSETDWNDQFGDKLGTNSANIVTPITATDHLQMNFTQSGSVKFRLGYLSADQAGQDVSVRKFDVDVGSQTITYTTDPAIADIAPGTIPRPGDGVWSTDTIHLPDNWKGGNLFAQYVAGAGDTSSWQLLGVGENGQVRLIR